MFLRTEDLFTSFKKQYIFKLKAYSNLFVSMIIFQVLGILLSLAHLSNMGSSSSYYSIDINQIFTLPVIIVSIAYIISVSVCLNLNDYKNIDFIYTTNRLSSNLSNIAFLVTFILFSAFNAALSSIFIRIIDYTILGSSNIIETGFFISPGELLCSFYVIFLYILLISSISYFCTTLIQKFEFYSLGFFICLIVVLYFVSLTNIIRFYISESSLLVFSFKVLLTSITLFAISSVFSNDLEVKL